MLAPAPLTPDERRALGIAALTAAVTAAAAALASGLVTWGIETVKKKADGAGERAAGDAAAR